jgi:ketosteroid isomerase-like protein
MPRKLNLIILALLLIVGAGCAKKEVDVEAERDALRKADIQWSSTAGDVDAWTAYFAPDGAMYPPNEPARVGVDQIREWGTMMMSMPGFSVSWQPETVEVAASGDIGYTAGTFKLAALEPMINDHGKYLCTWKKDASGAWKVAVDMFSSDVAMMPASMMEDTTLEPK